MKISVAALLMMLTLVSSRFINDGNEDDKEATFVPKTMPVIESQSRLLETMEDKIKSDYEEEVKSDYEEEVKSDYEEEVKSDYEEEVKSKVTLVDPNVFESEPPSTLLEGTGDFEDEVESKVTLVHPNGIETDSPRVKKSKPDNALKLDSGIPEIMDHKTAPKYSALHEPCELPKLANGDARLQCYQYPTYTICNHTCAFGYTHEEGVYKVITCKNKERRWKPDFEHCKPFIDCTLSIVGGYYKCEYKDFYEEPTCYINCNTTDGFNLPIEDTYQCDIYGEWWPKLPWCVKPRGIKLVNPPLGKYRAVDY